MQVMWKHAFAVKCGTTYAKNTENSIHSTQNIDSSFLGHLKWYFSFYFLEISMHLIAMLQNEIFRRALTPEIRYS